MELTAKINQDQLKEAIDKAALKGAVDVINDYYTGYNSPYKKALKEELEKKTINLIGLNLPDIIGLINDKMKQEIEVIANNAVAQTYLPMLQNSIFRHEKEVNFSEIIKKLIKVHDIDYSNQDDWEIIIDESKEYKWLNISIEENKKKLYRFTMHYRKENEKYIILSLPRNDGEWIKYTNEETKTQVEIPMLPDFLSDEVNSLIASLIISGSEIELDCEGFEDWMFDEKCHC